MDTQVKEAYDAYLNGDGRNIFKQDDPIIAARCFEAGWTANPAAALAATTVVGQQEGGGFEKPVLDMAEFTLTVFSVLEENDMLSHVESDDEPAVAAEIILELGTSGVSVVPTEWIVRLETAALSAGAALPVVAEPTPEGEWTPRRVLNRALNKRFGHDLDGPIPWSNMTPKVVYDVALEVLQACEKFLLSASKAANDARAELAAALPGSGSQAADCPNCQGSGREGGAAGYDRDCDQCEGTGTIDTPPAPSLTNNGKEPGRA